MHILNTNFGVILGLVYGFIVFMMLPLYAALERMDVSLIEAGRDLYGGPLRTFLTVTVPATRQGALAGLVLVFLPAIGDFVSAQLMGGPNQIMIGNLIQQKFFEGNNQPLGSALTMVLLLVLLIGMVGYLRRARRDEEDARRDEPHPSSTQAQRGRAQAAHRDRHHRDVLRAALPADRGRRAVLVQLAEVADRLQGLQLPLVRRVLPRPRPDRARSG